MLTGCDTLLSPEPKGQIALDDLLATESGIITAVNGVYEPLHGIYRSDLIRLTELGSDDGWIWRKEVEPDIFIIDETYGGIQNLWSAHYTGITRANTVLNRIGKLEEFSSESLKKSLTGQAQFLRAFYYFNLVRIYGGVPMIVDEITSREDSEKPRGTIQEAYDQIKSDLAEAVALLPDSHQGGPAGQSGMVTSRSAKALLALVHLELEEWEEVVHSSNDLIPIGRLQASYADNFNGTQENGLHSFFEVQYGGVSAATTTQLSNTYAPPDYGGLAAVMPTDERLEGKGGSLSSGNGFMQAFEPGDQRKAVIVADYGLPNFIDPSKPDGSLLFVNKYYNTRDARGLSTWNYPLIRFAEILLARAEALNEAGYASNGEAFELLNQIRTNAGLAPYSASALPDQASFREALRKERRIELSFEAKRYFDLNRWGILEESIQIQMDLLGLSFPKNRIIVHPITGKKYYLYPLPSIEFVNNANLGEQNAGY